jgi:hypothetical protein
MFLYSMDPAYWLLWNECCGYESLHDWEPYENVECDLSSEDLLAVLEKFLAKEMELGEGCKKDIAPLVEWISNFPAQATESLEQQLKSVTNEDALAEQETPP